MNNIKATQTEGFINSVLMHPQLFIHQGRNAGMYLWESVRSKQRIRQQRSAFTQLKVRVHEWQLLVNFEAAAAVYLRFQVLWIKTTCRWQAAPHRLKKHSAFDFQGTVLLRKVGNNEFGDTASFLRLRPVCQRPAVTRVHPPSPPPHSLERTHPHTCM
jgi:hypothetical protein